MCALRVRVCYAHVFVCECAFIINQHLLKAKVETFNQMNSTIQLYTQVLAVVTWTSLLAPTSTLGKTRGVFGVDGFDKSVIS